MSETDASIHAAFPHVDRAENVVVVRLDQTIDAAVIDQAMRPDSP